MSEVSLKEYFDTKLTALEARVAEQRTSDQRALALQATEYERRLQILNNEHARVDRIVQQIGESKISREEWDNFHQTALKADFIPRAEFFNFKETNKEERDRVLHELDVAGRIRALLYSTIVVGISLSGFLFNFFWRK